MPSGDDNGQPLRRSQRRRRPVICSLCGCAMCNPTPPKRPRRSRAKSPAGGSLGGGGIVTSSSGSPAAADRQSATASPVQSTSTSGLLFGSASQIAAAQTSPSSLNIGQPFTFSATTVASSTVDQTSSAAGPWTAAGVGSQAQSCSSVPPLGHCGSSDQFTFASPLPLPCADYASPGDSASPGSSANDQSTTPACTSSSPPPSSSSLGSPLSPSPGLVPELATSPDGQRSDASVGVSSPSSPARPSSSTARATSAPVVGSLRSDSEEDCSASAPPSLFPLVNQPSATTSSSVHTPANLFPSSVASNQSLNRSRTPSRTSVEGQASSSTFHRPVRTPSPVSSSCAQVSGWSPGSSVSTSAGTQANTVFGTETSVSSGPSGSQNFSSPLTQTSGSTSGSCSTLAPIFDVPSSAVTAHGSSTQTFGSPLPSSSCTTNNSRFSFRFGNVSTTESNMEVGQPLGTPASNCQTPITTCWGGYSNDSSGQVPPTADSSGCSFHFGYVSTAQSNMDVGTPASASTNSQTPITTCWRWHSHDSSSQVSTTVSGSGHSFRFGYVSTAQSNMDVGQPLGTPASNCQTPVTTCWRWRSNDSSTSNLPPSTRSSPFWSTTSSAESGHRFGFPSDSCQPATTTIFGPARTSTQPTTSVDVAGTLPPPTTPIQTSSHQQHTIDHRRSSTTVSWTSQGAVMSTTSSQPRLHDSPAPSSHGIYQSPSTLQVVILCR